MEATEIRRKRDVVRRSITNLAKRLVDLKALTDTSEQFSRALRLSTRLTDLDSEFKSLQYDLISKMDETDTASINTEQDALDKHDRDVDTLSIQLQQLLRSTDPRVTESSEERILKQNLAAIDRSLKAVSDKLKALPTDVADLALVQQLQEELTDVKADLSSCQGALHHMGIIEEHELYAKYYQLKKTHFDCCHTVKKTINSCTPSVTPLTAPPSEAPTTKGGLKVPKLEAPTFDGDILHWIRFWEQFTISIDQQTNLSEAEKFAYLQQSLQGGPARSVIQGLSGTGEHYTKAVECLKARYDRPRLIHQSHVKTILEIPLIKEGTGKELRRLHDTLQ